MQAGRLQCSDPALQAHLLHQVALACGQMQTSRPPYPGSMVQVRPLAVPAHHQPLALLTWAGSDCSHCSAAFLQTALGLTLSEACLAQHLLAGGTVKDFACRQGCSWHTARTHAKNLLQKTGCHSQAELVRLVRSLAQG